MGHSVSRLRRRIKRDARIMASKLVPSAKAPANNNNNDQDMDEASSSAEPFSFNNEKVSMENFELIRILGKGAYGKVFLVRKLGGPDHGTLYAMKVLRKTRVMQKPKTLEHTISERKVLEHIKAAPFLVNLRYAFQSPAKLHLIMDYVRGGELFTHLCQKGAFDLSTTRFYIGELVIALEHLHNINIFYRDLKLENVMLDNEGHVTLTDFGLSKEFEDTDETVDWWSLGVLTFELLTGCSPFTVEGAKNSSKEIADRILTKKVPYPRNIDATAKDFVGQLLMKDPRKRLGAKGVHEIKQHPFFASLDWDALGARRLPPPIEPTLRSLLDVHNFPEEFTKQKPVYSPVDSPDANANTKKLFRGYSFISPSVMLSNDNVIGEAYLESMQISDNQSNANAQNANRVGCPLQKFGEDQNSAFFKQYVLDLTDDGQLGHGSFSVVRKCRHKETGLQYGVKIISQRFANQAKREAQILTLCYEHPNIVKLHATLQDQYFFYLVMELIRGPELLTKLRQAKHFTEAEASRIFRKVVSCVQFLHHKNVVHRDLKPENILFESTEDNADVRLIDFGFARLLPASGLSYCWRATLNTPCYTLHYAAPEVLHKDANITARVADMLPTDGDMLPEYNQQCDLWSLGVILFTMLSGRVPFHVKTKFESANDIIARIRKAEFSFDTVEWHGVSKQAKDLIRALLSVDPATRPTVDQVYSNEWVQGKGNSPATPLATPTVLSSAASRTFNETMVAFLTANKEGFHLADVAAAPLAQRRQKKNDRTASESSTLPMDTGAASTESSESGSSGKGAQGARKRKLFVVPEESGSTATSVDTSLAKRPDTLPLSPDFTQYREPPPEALRQTRETEHTEQQGEEAHGAGKNA